MDFVGHPAVEHDMDMQWRGQIAEGYSYFWATINALFPVLLLLPYGNWSAAFPYFF
jgi:hypothetical protein